MKNCVTKKSKTEKMICCPNCSSDLFYRHVLDVTIYEQSDLRITDDGEIQEKYPNYPRSIWGRADAAGPLTEVTGPLMDYYRCQHCDHKYIFDMETKKLIPFKKIDSPLWKIFEKKGKNPTRREIEAFENIFKVLQIPDYIKAQPTDRWKRMMDFMENFE